MMAAARGVTLSFGVRNQILQGMLTLPAHADVRAGLEAMRDAGLRLVTLTNSAPAAARQQLANAGLARFFERSFSVDAVRRFKPAPEVYQSAAEALGAPIEGLRMVAAHAWDVHGALRAGCAAAFVARPGRSCTHSARNPISAARTSRTSRSKSCPSSVSELMGSSAIGWLHSPT